MASEMSVKFSLVPELNVAVLNNFLSVIKQALGDLGKSVQLIDPKVFDEATKAYSNAVSNIPSTTIPAPKVETPKIPPPDTKDTESAGKNAGLNFKDKFLTGISGLQQGVNGVMGGILGVFGGNLLTKGFTGIIGGFDSLLEKGKASMKATEGLSVAFAQAGKSGSDLSSAVKDTGKYATSLAQQFALPISQVRAFSQTAAAIGGATGKANQDLTMLAIGIEKASNGLVSGDMAIRLFSKGVSDPESQFALGRLTKQFPALAAALKGVEDPAMATQQALSFFAPTFDQMKEQANGPIGSMERLDISLGQIKSGLGKVIIEGVAPFVSAFANNIIPGLQSAVSVIGSAAGALKPLAPVFMAVGTAAGVMVTAMLGLQGLKFITGLATSATQFGLALLQKVIPALVVQDITTKSMMLNSQAMNLATLKQIALDGLHTVALGIKTAALWSANAALSVMNALFLASPIGWVVVGIAGLVTGFILLYKHVEAFREAINKAFNFVAAIFSGVVNVVKSIFGSGGQSAGEAFKNGFNSSMTENSFKDAKDKVDKAFKSGTQLNVKIQANADFEKTLKEYEKLQARVAELSQKKAAGTITADEQSEFEKTTSKVNELKKKLGEISPEAKTNLKAVVDANGNLVESYDLNIQKLKEMQSAQGQALGGEQGSAVKKYSDSLIELAGKYGEQKNYLADLKRQIDSTNDPTTKQKLMDAYNEENSKINKNKQALAESLAAGMDAGLLTAQSIQNVATQLGITETQAREMALAKALKKASDEGKLTAESASHMGIKYGVSHEKVQQNVAELQKAKQTAEQTKKELMGWSESLDASKKAIEESNKKIIQAAIDLKNRKISQEQYNQTIADETKKNKENIEQTKLIGKTKEELNKQGLLGKAYEEQTQKASKETQKEKKAEYELAKEKYDLQKKSLENDLESKQTESDMLRQAQGRTKNVYDEISANNLKLESLKSQKSELDKLSELITKNAQGEVISIKGVKKENISKVYGDYLSEVTKLNKDIASTENAGLDLQAKIKLDPLELEKKQIEIKKQNLELKIKLGIAQESDLLPVLKEEIGNAQKFLEQEQIKQNNLIKSFGSGEISPAQKKALEDAQVSVNTATNNLMKAQEDLKNSEKKNQDEQVKNHEETFKKKEALLNKELDMQKKFFDAFQKAFDAATQSQINAEKDKELKLLDQQFGKATATDPKEEAYNRKKHEIEQKYQRQQLAQQAVSQGLQLEQQRQTDLKLLQQKQESEEKKLKAMDKSVDPKAYEAQVKALEDVNNQVKEKGDMTAQIMAGMQENIGEFAGNLFSGNEEGMKQSATKMFGQLAGIIKKMLTATIMEQVLAQVGSLGPYGWLLTPVIYAAIYTALSAVVDPILGSLTSFAGGGEITSPTFALVGDAKNSGNASNTEWVFNSKLINTFIDRIVTETMDKFVSELNSGLSKYNEQLNAMLTGNNISYSSESIASEMLLAQQDAIMKPVVDSIAILTTSLAENNKRTQELADLTNSIDNLTVTLDYIEQNNPEDILDNEIVYSFMYKSLEHYQLIENKLDRIYDAIERGGVITLNGRVLTEEVNRTNLGMNARTRTPLTIA